MANRIILNETSYHGQGAILSITEEAKLRGFKKAFVCSDPDLIKFNVTKKVTDLLDKEGLEYEIYSDIKANPTIENVQSGVAAFKKSGADYIIAIGGGSSMDTSKAIGIIITNPEFEDVRSLEGLSPTKNPCVPIFAVPTTAGTAAEVTINYVITDVEKKRKFTAEGREGMAIGQYLTGMGFSNCGLGIVHSMAHGLGALYDTPHGVANAIILPTVMEYNADAVGEKLRDVAKAMGVEGTEKMSEAEYKKAAVDAVKKLSEDVGIPKDLKEIVKPEDVDFLSQSAMDDACRPGNPRDPKFEDIKELFLSLM